MKKIYVKHLETEMKRMTVQRRVSTVKVRQKPAYDRPIGSY